MRLKKSISLLLLLLMSVVLISGCGNKQVTETEETTTGTVQRGDLSLDISAVGNLALSTKENLTFGLAGTVSEVLVEEGDSVEEGQVLAKLDMSERQDQLKALEDIIETKEQALTQAENNVENAEDAYNEINNETYLEMAIAQAELEVANAEIALSNAQDSYDYAKAQYDSNWTVPGFIRNYEQKKAQLAIAELNLEEAEDALASVESDIESERDSKAYDLTIAQKNLEDAQAELDDAQEDYDEAFSQDWTVTAPFDGFVTAVNINEGDEVLKGTPVIEIADPDEFEADVYVSEMDIFNVSIGTSATVQVDAAESMVLPAEVEKIASTATIQSGVVNYQVKVKIQSLESIAQERMSTIADEMQKAAEAIEAGELPEMLKQAVEAGRMTQEEAEAMVEKMQSSNFFTPPEDSEGSMPSRPEGKEGGFGIFSGDTEGFSFGGPGIAGGLSGETVNASGYTTVSASDFQLREGLTVTVSIITEERNDVLLVPSAAIHTTNGQSAVTVINDDGTEEERIIVAGLSDWQNTEIISGLSEGEQVVAPITSSSSTTTQSQGGTFRTFTIPGGGIMR